MNEIISVDILPVLQAVEFLLNVTLKATLGVVVFGFILYLGFSLLLDREQ